jgi:hypothetical protein
MKLGLGLPSAPPRSEGSQSLTLTSHSLSLCVHIIFPDCIYKLIWGG